MILVSDPRPTGAAWNGGTSAWMMSDQSRDELLGFAQSIGLDPRWERTEPYPHFEISPRYRRRALKAGAQPVHHPAAWRAAIARLRAADQAAFERFVEWLTNGPDRGPLVP